MRNKDGLSIMKVFIIGSSGFIGKNLQSYLSTKKNFEVTGFSSKDCNLLEFEQVKKAMQKADSDTSIIFCAAISRIEEDSWNTMQKNILMMHNFLSSIADKKVRSIIFFSSSDVYGLPAANLPITESTLPEPKGYYGISKLISEKMLGFKLPLSTPATILRLPGVFGKGDNYQSIIGQFTKKMMSKQAITLNNNGNTKRDYVEVEDLCRIIEHFLSQPYNGVVNIATGKSKPLKEITSIIAKELKAKPEINLSETKNDRTSDLAFDNSKLKKLCPGIKLKELEQGIKKYVRDMKN